MRRASALLALVLVAGCGADEKYPALSGSASSATTETTIEHDDPPPVVVRWDGGEVALVPWTSCFGNVCADGMRPTDVPSIGDPSVVTVEFPVDGWSFEAAFRPEGETCGRQETATLAAGDALTPHGAAGAKDVTLFGRGPGGDVFVSFRWSTPVDGPLTPPGSTASIVADHDGVPDSYGVELGAHHLATTPTDAVAFVVVTAASGASRTIELRRVEGECADDSVRFDADIAEGIAAAELGDPPFTYDVTLTLDGTVHRATATWPDDEDPECSPCVPLLYDPPLPTATIP